jgi:hypothetical protein
LTTVRSLHSHRPFGSARWPARAAAALTLAGLIAGTTLAQPAEAATKRFVTIAGHMTIHDVDAGMSCDLPFIANRIIVTKRTNFGFTKDCGSIRGELFETVEPRADAYIQLRGWVRVTDQQPSGERELAWEPFATFVHDDGVDYTRPHTFGDANVGTVQFEWEDISETGPQIFVPFVGQSPLPPPGSGF